MSAYLSFVVVDAFADVPFMGNGVAVVLVEGVSASDVWLSTLATEMQQSNTAFVWRTERRDQFTIRVFTKTGEEQVLAGHATVAVVHSLFVSGLSQEGNVTLLTRAGELQCNASPATPSDGNPFVTAEFPSVSCAEIQRPDGPEAVRVALGGGTIPLPVWIGKAETNDLMVVFESAEVVRSLRPDLTACKLLSERGVIVTAAAHGATPWAGEADFVCRWFAPRIGIDEGATTVSAHCALGPFWAARLGKLNLVGYQCSARAASIAMHVNMQGARVTLAGRCCTTLRGEVLAVPGAQLTRRTNSGFMSMSQG